MLRRRLAGAALAALAAALLATAGVASGAQAGDQALVRVAHFAPGLLKGDVYVIYVNGRLQLKGVRFKTVSDYLKVKPGRFKVEVREAGEPASSTPVIASASDYQEVPAGTVDVEVRKAGSDQVLAKANNLKRPSGSISSLVAVGGIGEKLELLAIRDAAAAVSAAGGAAIGVGGTSPGSSPGGWRYALLLLVGGGLAAATGFAVRQRRSSG
jgi:hypothetical protein